MANTGWQANERSRPKAAARAAGDRGDEAQDQVPKCGLWWLFIPLFVGMILVVLYDRCGIARVLIKMPWNRDVKLP